MVLIMGAQLQAMEHADIAVSSKQDDELRSLIWDIELYILSKLDGNTLINEQKVSNVEHRVRQAQITIVLRLQSWLVDNEKANDFMNYCYFMHKCSPHMSMTHLMRLERAYNILYQSLQYACQLVWPDKIGDTSLYSWYK